MPRRRFSSRSSSTCARSSASRLSSDCRKRKKPSSRKAKARTRLISCSFGASEQPGDHPGHALPALPFLSKLLAARARQRVILGLAVVVGQAPPRADPPALLETQERRIQRSLIELEQVEGYLLDALRYAVTMERAHGVERFQHDQVQRALQHFTARRCHRPTPLAKRQEPMLVPVDCQQVGFSLYAPSAQDSFSARLW